MAKFYIYRNLRTGGFSIKQSGIVIDRSDWFTAADVTFKVNEKGRLRVINEKRKNVHAYIVCDKYKSSCIKNISELSSISYNPYKSSHFSCNGQNIHAAKKVLFKQGKCYLIKR